MPLLPQPNCQRSPETTPRVPSPLSTNRQGSRSETASADDIRNPSPDHLPFSRFRAPTAPPTIYQYTDRPGPCQTPSPWTAQLCPGPRHRWPESRHRKQPKGIISGRLARSSQGKPKNDPLGAQLLSSDPGQRTRFPRRRDRADFGAPPQLRTQRLHRRFAGAETGVTSSASGIGHPCAGEPGWETRSPRDKRLMGPKATMHQIPVVREATIDF